MVNIGVDFGSTYTLVSVFRKDTNTLEALSLDQGSPYVPSIVSLNAKGRYEFGNGAKSLTGKKGTRIFKAFKMMIAESDKEYLEKRGFDKENSPEKIAKEFLTSLFTKVLEDLGEKKIDTLVMGVPEIWSEKFSTVDGRSILRNICKETNLVNDVRIVSEPAAASAYFAYNYSVNMGRGFIGNILLIDYGGGTLDITLTNVTPSKNKKSGINDCFEIKILDRTGAGENEEGKVGKAGVVYMETVMEKAIAQALEIPQSKVTYDTKFYKAVDELEKQLQNLTGTIKDIFEEYDQDIDGLNDEEFTTIEYKGEDIEISYGILLKTYNEVIRDVLDRKLNEMIIFMKRNNIDYMNKDRDDFKIALVGGFGNFYLVRQQVREKFKIVSDNDKKIVGIIKNRADCEKAISLGAALLANDIIGIRNTAPYSIGVLSYNEKGEIAYKYAIKYKQDIDYGKVYYSLGSDNNYFIIRAVNGGFNKFLVNFGYDDKTAFVALAKREFARKLSNIINNQHHTAVVGFSIDSSGVLSLHIKFYDPFENKIDNKDHIVELTRLKDLFEVTGFTAKGG